MPLPMTLNAVRAEFGTVNGVGKAVQSGGVDRRRQDGAKSRAGKRPREDETSSKLDARKRDAVPVTRAAVDRTLCVENAQRVESNNATHVTRPDEDSMPRARRGRHHQDSFLDARKRDAVPVTRAAVDRNRRDKNARRVESVRTTTPANRHSDTESRERKRGQKHEVSESNADAEQRNAVPAAPRAAVDPVTTPGTTASSNASTIAMKKVLQHQRKMEEHRRKMEKALRNEGSTCSASRALGYLALPGQVGVKLSLKNSGDMVTACFKKIAASVRCKYNRKVLIAKSKPLQCIVENTHRMMADVFAHFGNLRMVLHYNNLEIPNSWMENTAISQFCTDTEEISILKFEYSLVRHHGDDGRNEAPEADEGETQDPDADHAVHRFADALVHETEIGVDSVEAQSDGEAPVTDEDEPHDSLADEMGDHAADTWAHQEAIAVDAVGAQPDREALPAADAPDGEAPTVDGVHEPHDSLANQMLVDHMVDQAADAWAHREATAVDAVGAPHDSDVPAVDKEEATHDDPDADPRTPTAGREGAAVSSIERYTNEAGRVYAEREGEMLYQMDGGVRIMCFDSATGLCSKMEGGEWVPCISDEVGMSASGGVTQKSEASGRHSNSDIEARRKCFLSMCETHGGASIERYASEAGRVYAEREGKMLYQMDHGVRIECIDCMTGLCSKLEGGEWVPCVSDEVGTSASGGVAEKSEASGRHSHHAVDKKVAEFFNKCETHGGFSVGKRDNMTASGYGRTCMPDAVLTIESHLKNTRVTDKSKALIRKWFRERHPGGGDPNQFDLQEYGKQHGLDIKHIGKLTNSPRGLLPLRGSYLVRLEYTYEDKDGTLKIEAHYMAYIDHKLLDNNKSIDPLVIVESDWKKNKDTKESANHMAIKPFFHFFDETTKKIALTHAYEITRNALKRARDE
jgi:hypothetical protein